MKNLVLGLLLLAGSVSAQLNYAGFGDTATITAFRADSLSFSKVFPLSQYENAAFIAMTNDTSSAGYASDSIKYRWGIQVGDIVLNRSGKIDTTWRAKICIDTFDIMTAGNLTDPINAVGTDGSYSLPLKFIDSVNVLNYAVQDRNFTPEWGTLFRFWCKGLTGNEKGSFLAHRFAVVRREYINVRIK